MLWHRLSSETLFRTATTGATTAHRPRGYLQREAGTHTAPPAPTAARTVPSPPPHKGGAARHPPPPPAGLRATGLAPSAHPAAPGRAAASRPGGPKGGGAPGQLPPHQSGPARGSGGAAIPTAGPHRLSSSLRLSGTRRLSSARSPLPALPAPSPLSRNASFTSQPRPLPIAAGARPDLLAACCIRPSAQAPRSGSPARPPRAADARAPPPGRSRAPRRNPSWGGGQEGGLQTPLPALPARAAQKRPPPAHTHPRSWRSAVPRYGRRSDSSPAEPGGAEKSILRPWRRAAAEARFPNKRLEEALGRLLPHLFFLLSLLLFPFKKFIYLEDPPPRIDATPRRRAERKPVPPAPGWFKVRRQPRGLQLCPPALPSRQEAAGAQLRTPARRGTTGEAPEPAPVNGEGADAELPLRARSLYKQRAIVH